MKKRIPLADAKMEIARINEILDTPHLLIGGLAVNQYTMRVSQDIDLVIDFDRANEIIQKLYPNLLWNRVDRNDDEFRPSYEITNRQDPSLCIRFGPKILQREPYDFIDWDILIKKAKRFKYKNEFLDNILIPSAVDLSFTKILSYISRKGKNREKSEMDLIDFVQLTNNEEWNTIDFFSILNNTDAIDYLRANLRFNESEIETIEYSSLFQLVDLFREPINGLKALNDSKFFLSNEDILNIINSAAGNFANELTTGIKSMIGIDIQGFRAINMKYGKDLADKVIDIINKLITEKKDKTARKIIILGDTFFVFSTIENKKQLRRYALNIYSKISDFNWESISKSLFVNVYLTYGLSNPEEDISSFSLRILDTIADAKESSKNFLEIKEERTRDWGYDGYLS